MNRNLHVENAGMAREVDMFDKKKGGVLDMVGKIKPRTAEAEKPPNGKHAEAAKHEKKSDNQGAEDEHEQHEHKRKKKHHKPGSDGDVRSDSDANEPEKVGSDEGSNFRFGDAEDPLSSRRSSQDKTTETKKLLEAVHHVEDRLKTREQINLTMMTIEVANLPTTHRFTKNCPWLKGSYGTTYSWVAEYEEHEDGTRAVWKNMRWSFNLERNEKDRNDLVITVCSKNLIIGRYVLGKEEFADIPETKTGYFEVAGDILSGIGPAGKIRILFLRGKAERPKGPMKPVLPSQITPANNPVSPLKQAAVLQKRLYVKVLSAAVMDLKAVHFLDVNCPFIAVEVGDWVGISDTAHNAGMAARWNSLNWKFTVTADVGVHLMIHSKNVMIGRMHVSLEEITNIEPRQNGIIEVIKHITDGKDVTGKVKLNILAESPKAEDGGLEEGKSEMLNGDVKTVDADGNLLESTDGTVAQPVAQSPSVTTYPGASDLAPLKPFMRVPFQINVHEVTLLDTIKAQYWRTNALAVNVVCGSWGKATEELKNAGSFAHWIDLKWKIPVKGNNNLRITAWSHGKPVGSANVTVAELLEMPTDYEHNTEIFAKLTNSAGEIVGKVKLSCKYESLISVINDKIVAISKGSAATERDDRASPTAMLMTSEKISKKAPKEFLPNVGTEKVKSVTFGGDGDEDDDFDFEDPDTSSKRIPASRRQELSLPIVATIKSISVYDAVPVHVFSRNAPYIKFICDRKSATTEAVKNAGAVATWPGLDWIMKIREDSHVVAILMSKDVMIGKVEFKPKDLLHIPLNDEGHTEIKTLFKKDGSTTAKLHLIADLKSLEDVLPTDSTLPTPGSRLVSGGGAGGMGPAAPYGRQRGGPPAYGNTAGALDGLSIASFSGQLPQLGPPQYAQFPQPTPMFTPPGHNAASYYGGGGSVSQRVPTIPAVRPPLGNSFSYPNQYAASGAGYGTNGNMQESPYNIFSPPSAKGPAFFTPDGQDFDQRSVTWGNSMLLQQQAQTGPQSPGQIPIFDRNLMSAENARKLGLSFNLAIQEIDLIDLKPMHTFAKNCPFVSAACGKWTASTEAIQNAGDTAYWTKLNWKSNCKSGGNLRLIVTSKKVVMGSVNFSSDDLLNAISDDRGLRRVTGKITSESNEVTGRIKVAYTMDISKQTAAGPNSPPQQQQVPFAAGLNGVNAGASFSASMMSMRDAPLVGTAGVVTGTGATTFGASTRGSAFGAASPYGAPPQSQRVPTIIPANQAQQQYPFEMGDDSYYDELIDPDPRKHVQFPFNIHIVELSTLDLLSAHQLKRNQPVVKVFCDTFYSETKVAAEYTDVTYFRELNWIFPVKEKSIFKITVASRGKDIGSVMVDLFALKDIPFDQAGLREMVLSVQDERGRTAGKVRMIVKLSNAAINDYDYRNSLADEPLGMDGVSVREGAGGANAFINTGTGSSKKRDGGGMSVAGAGAGASVLGGPGGSGKGVAYGKDFDYLLQSQVEEANELSSVALLSCTLVGIAVIDLRSVHTFAPNSPCANIACGKVVATTPAAENAGKMANWEDLSIKMPIDRSSNLRVLISSGDKVIGQCSVNRSKLLGGRKNQKGLYVLFGELENNGKPAGKIKFIYSLVDPAA